MSGWKVWLLVLAFAASIVLTGVFGFRAVHHRRHLRSDETIRPWMSVPYVAHSYHVPPSVLYDALKIPHQTHDRRPIRDIARSQNRSVESVIADLMKAIEESPRQPSPGPAHSPTPRTSV